MSVLSTQSSGLTRGALIVGYVACAAIIVGCFGPWQTFLPGVLDVHLKGADYSEGKLSLALAAIGAVGLLAWSLGRSRRAARFTAVAGAVATLITLNDTIRFGPHGGPGFQLGWGLVVALIGSGALFLASLLLIRAPDRGSST